MTMSTLTYYEIYDNTLQLTLRKFYSSLYDVVVDANKLNMACKQLKRFTIKPIKMSSLRR